MMNLDENMPRCWTVFYNFLRNVETCRALYCGGPAGWGKTYLPLHESVPAGGVYALTLTPETSSAELRGHFVFKGQDTVWMDGPCVKTFRSTDPVRLLINELPNAGDDALAMLYPIMEDPSTAILTLPTGETVTPEGPIQIVATGNHSLDTLPSDMREAIANRFEVKLYLDAPNPESVKALPHDMQAAALEALKVTDPDRTTSLRQWYAFARYGEVFGREEAAMMVFGDQYGRGILEGLASAAV